MLAGLKLVFKRFMNEKYLLWISVFLVALFCLPFLVLGEDASVTINDNLDSIFVWFKVVLETDTLFAPNNADVAPFMGGLKRVSFPGEFNFTYLWFWIFGPIGAYIFERFLLCYIAFFGMLLLLKRYVIPGDKNLLIQFGVAVSFALLPHWPFGGMCVPGLPLLFYAFLNLLNGKKHYGNWLIIIIYPFYSSLITSGFFFIGLLLLLLVNHLLAKKKVPFNYYGGILLLGLLYIISHYRLFLMYFLQKNNLTHREEFVREKLNLGMSFKHLVHGLYFSNEIVFTTVLISAILMWRRNEMQSMFKKMFLFILLSQFIISFLDYVHFSSFSASLFKLIPVNLERVSWLYPLLWMMLFAVSLAYLMKNSRLGSSLVLLIFSFQLALNISKHEILVTSLSIKSGSLKIEKDPTFKTFFASKQFSEIANYIGKDKNSYRILSLGIHPSISQYNGFYTLDGYASLYELRYKQLFRQLIHDEIKKNPAVNTYFETWGSRAYFFTASDIGYMNLKNNQIVLPQLDFNFEKIKQLKGEYIFSAVQLGEKQHPSLVFLKKFSNDDSAWDIYLYKIL